MKSPDRGVKTIWGSKEKNRGPTIEYLKEKKERKQLRKKRTKGRKK